MPEVHIPESLFAEIEKALPMAKAGSPDDFVVQAVREKLTLEDHKREFYRLSDQTRAAVQEKGLSEADILREFDVSRGRPNG